MTDELEAKEAGKADPSLEDLDDIDGPIDDAWAAEVNRRWSEKAKPVEKKLKATRKRKNNKPDA